MNIVLIGIDDTDNDSSPGTGRQARRLSAELAARGATPMGVTRHQFLVDSRIPYTSHNSGACIAIGWDRPVRQLDFAAELITDWSAPGSDPGICIAPADSVPSEIMNWGSSATREVLTIDRAISLAQTAGMRLTPLGGTGQGIIGALAAVGLRANGNDGRFLDLPGLRDLSGVVTREELTRLGIALQHNGPPASDHATYQTLNWVRPRLIGGKPVWPVQWSAEQNVWIPVDRKKERSVDKARG